MLVRRSLLEEKVKVPSLLRFASSPFDPGEKITKYKASYMERTARSRGKEGPVIKRKKAVHAITEREMLERLEGNGKKNEENKGKKKGHSPSWRGDLPAYRS